MSKPHYSNSKIDNTLSYLMAGLLALFLFGIVVAGMDLSQRSAEESVSRAPEASVSESAEIGF